MAEIIPLDPLIADKWLASWIARDPFSEAAVRDLEAALPAPHCVVVVTLTRAGLPASLVFRAQKTVTPAGKRLKAEIESPAGRMALDVSFHNRPIDLDPLSTGRVMTMQGESPCSFDAALAIAQSLVRWWPCPVIYTLDGTFYGRA